MSHLGIPIFVPGTMPTPGRYYAVFNVVGADASKPAPAIAGDMVWCLDTGLLYGSTDGETWTACGGAPGPQGPAGPTGPTGPAGSAGATGAAGPQGVQGVPGVPGNDGATGPAGADGAVGATGPQGSQGIQGIPGPAGSSGANGASGGSRVLLHPGMAASAAATNLAANTWNAVSDPSYRQMTDLRGLSKVRIQGRIGGSLTPATKLRVQYHVGGNPAVASADAGWTTLAESAGAHTLNTMFYSAEISVPAGAQVNDVLIRVGLFGGDGVADPTITCAVLNFYP